MAGSSTTLVTHQIPEPSVGRITYDFVGDDTDGHMDPVVLPTVDGRILAITTVPGTPGPTALHDVTAVDQDGFDVLGGAGADRSSDTPERAAVSDGYVSRRDEITLAIANTSVNDAETRVTLHYTQDVR
jgi:hypothetical protein